MANSYFHFKQFTIEQDLAGMKVGTDGVLLGAWAQCKKAKSILDVGTGTGLIALMCAQRNDVAHIDALEIDANACLQAEKNIQNSPWSDRINVIHNSFQSYFRISDRKFDFIISNPPFFNNSLKNNCHQKSLARHTDSLSFKDLLVGVNKLLHDKGVFSVVLPSESMEYFVTIAEELHLNLVRVLRVKPTPSKKEKRVLMAFAKVKEPCNEEVIVVEEFGRHGYSDCYKKLTGDFYIKF